MPARTQTCRRRLAATGAAVLTLLSLVAVSAPVDAASRVTGTSAQLLARLTTAPEHGAGYSRTLFVHWIDADGDGCDTRREVLIAESRTTVRIGAGCALNGGSWRSAYDGRTTSSASTFDIDHVVPLKEAWESGAWAWSAATRKSYANDLGDGRSLRAVSASSNRAKSDSDPAGWLPPLVSFRCTYVSDWIAIKVRWHLTVDRTERSALNRLVAGCPARSISVAMVSIGLAQPSPAATPTPTSTPTSGPTATPSASPTSVTRACDPNYAGYCVPVVPYDLDCSDIRHKVWVVGVDIHHFDADGDGVGCESYPG